MQSFSEYSEGIVVEGSNREMDILGLIKTYNGSAPVDIEDGYISTTVPTREQLDNILAGLHISVEADVMVRNLVRGFDDHTIKTVSDGGDEQEDTEYEITQGDYSEADVVYDLIIYTDNISILDELEERKRIIKVNAKGKRRYKVQCKKGFKFDGNKCVKIAGKELVTKRKAIRKAVRTKKAKGSGYTKRVARLQQRAMKKRKGMGLK